MTGRGAPLKYSEELAASICAAIAVGTPEAIAAQAAGISKDTITAWKKKYEDFSISVKRARAEAVKRRIERIEKAAKGGEEYETSEKVIKRKDGSIEKTTVRKKSYPTWQADAWYLERQFCEEFGLNRVELKELLHLLRDAKKARLGK